MIKLLILCEGNTDQILIGSYIENTTKWKYVTSKKQMPFEVEEINWYQEDDNLLGIWECGGYSFKQQLDLICKRELNEHVIQNLLIITDHDDSKAETDRLEEIKNALTHGLKSNDISELSADKLVTVHYNSAFEQAVCNIGYLLVPMDKQGALETFMLDALSQNKEDAANTIEQVDSFIQNYKSEVYLQKRRDRIKAKLGVSLSVFNPDRTFKIMKEIIDSVEWGRLDLSDSQFKMIRDCLDTDNDKE